MSKLVPLIKNLNKPFCINCTHFLKYKSQYPQGEMYENDRDVVFSTCKMFGNSDLVTGEIKLVLCTKSRSDMFMCGEFGKYFEPKK
jgi:hypothetical protein